MQDGGPHPLWKRFESGAQAAQEPAVAMAFATFLTPAAVMAGALGIWRLAEDPHWASDFAIRQGLFSHWQVWFAFAGLLQTGSYLLNRYGRADDEGARS